MNAGRPSSWPLPWRERFRYDSGKSRGDDESGNVRSGWLRVMTDHAERIMVGGDELIGPTGEETPVAASLTDTWAMVSRLQVDLAVRIGRENAARVCRLH